MAVSYAQFVAQFPEFDQLEEAYVTSKLDEAERVHDAAAFGSSYDDVCYYFAADSLARSPSGSGMGLVNDDDDTTVYGYKYKTIFAKSMWRRMLLSGGGLG